MALLNHQKTILKNVQNFKDLFIKEIKKSLNWLSPDERIDLEHWVAIELNQKYNGEVKQLFNQYSKLTNKQFN